MTSERISDMLFTRLGVVYSTLLIVTMLTACGGTGQPSDPSSEAVRLSFVVQPSNTTAAAPLSVAVALLDASGSIATRASASVTISLGVNPGGGTLTGATTVTAVDGMATFPSLAIDKAGNGYTLVASATSLLAATSTTFQIAPGPVTAIRLNPGAAVLTFPSGPIDVQFQATPLDAEGNVVISQPIAWTSADPSVASVNGLGVVTAGAEGLAAIHASAGGRTATAEVVVQCGPPRCTLSPAVSFVQQPATGQVGKVLPPVQVSIGGSGSVPGCWVGTASIRLGFNPSGAQLTGNSDLPISASNQTATWTNLKVDAAGSGYTLVAIVSGGCGTVEVGGRSSTGFTATP